MDKKRLDEIVAKKYNIAKVKAQKYIKDGLIEVNGKIITKNGHKIIEEDIESINIVEEKYSYVSQGALKLKKALEVFKINIKNNKCIDIGSSTGGFTEVLLENDIEKVYCIDVGSNQLDQKIRSNKKVVSIENTDIRDFKIKNEEQIDLVVGDISFISLKKIYEKIVEINPKKLILLVKPQFEAGIKLAKKSSGVITDEKIINNIVTDIIEYYTREDKFKYIDKVEAPIINIGKKRNKEWLIYLENSLI